MIQFYFGISFIEVLSALVFRICPFTWTRMTSSNKQVNVLLQRLSEAEQRAECLKLEIRDITNEIVNLKSLLTTPSHNLLKNNQVFTSRTSKTATKKKRGTEEPDLGCGDSKKQRNDHNFEFEDDYVIVYTDGACENNGKANAKAGIGVWFGDGNPLNISKPVFGRATNNTAEIQAPTEALKLLRELGYKKAKVLTDSQFTINCITKWIHNWKRNSWKLSSGGPVKNKEDLVKLDNIIQQFEHVKWITAF
ncbi:ribonuclease H1 isoform X2 [Cylas formicarius]|uniref:ribonuclease H1 isoform X2 n=1 Tax=Cylas formicarius TaxID=197179 RepID=UPI0029588C5B|nr:ribonuclease H1 isoform X2 [Cylas formicarius]